MLIPQAINGIASLEYDLQSQIKEMGKIMVAQQVG